MGIQNTSATPDSLCVCLSVSPPCRPPAAVSDFCHHSSVVFVWSFVHIESCSTYSFVCFLPFHVMILDILVVRSFFLSFPSFLPSEDYTEFIDFCFGGVFLAYLMHKVSKLFSCYLGKGYFRFCSYPPVGKRHLVCSYVGKI